MHQEFLSFGAELRRRRLAAGLSLSRLSNVERGIKAPSLEMAGVLAVPALCGGHATSSVNIDHADQAGIFRSLFEHYRNLGQDTDPSVLLPPLAAQFAKISGGDVRRNLLIIGSRYGRRLTPQSRECPMTIPSRNAVLTALATAGAIFVGLTIAARMSVLLALLIALVAGGVALAAVRRPRPVPLSAPVPADLGPSDLVTPEPPPVQAQPIAGVPLPSAHEDYTFVFSATVYWLPAVAGVTEPGVIAVSEIVRRAHQITQRRDPAQSVLVMHELAAFLADTRPDPGGRVYVRAESVELQLSADDQRRLEELTRLRKEEELWDYQRRHEQSKRRYLSEDVLKDAGSAVVWWLARNDDQPTKVAESIGVLTQLAHAANNADGDPAGAGNRSLTAAFGRSRTPVEHFGAFVDSLHLLDDDARLMLTKQMASLVESNGYPTVAREMRDQFDEGPDAASGMPADEPEPGEW
jgi:hypothetical protein